MSLRRRESKMPESSESFLAILFCPPEPDGLELIACRGDIAGALATILTEPPYGEGVDEAKVS